MIAMDVADVAAAVGGTLDACDDPGAAVLGAAADSRRVVPGDLYVAIAGERVDGHDFADAARAAGAVVTLGSRPTGGPTIVVDDPVEALGRLAGHVLASLPEATVVAVTGSSGKTTTKDLLAELLEHLGPTVATPGSFNTEVGMPLTILTATEATRFFVLEMGARGPGHITVLCQIARPGIGVVLNVGTAHVGEFGSREVTAASKAELVSALPPAGLAVLNLDDPLVAAMAQTTPARVAGFGTGPRAGIRVGNLHLDTQARAVFTMTTDEGDFPVALQLSGEHMASNAAAAAAVARHLGMPSQQIAERLSRAAPRSRWRMEVTTSPSGVIVVNDAYNANPESMRSALRSLAAMGESGGRTFAVLGEMRELGDDTVAEHDAIGRLAVRLHIARTICVGQGARALHLGAAQEGSWDGEASWVPDVPAAVAMLRAEVRPGDIVLVKASRSIGLEEVAAALLEDRT